MPAETIPSRTAVPLQDLLAERDYLTAWLFDEALPFWWETGGDHVRGGFFERVGLDGRPTAHDRRTRLIGRQIYSYATAGSLGWTGPAKAAVEHAVAYLDEKCMKPDGTAVATLSDAGEVVRGEFDLYDHAFVLFGLAAAARFGVDAARLTASAAAMRERIAAGWGHPVAGFEEAKPRRLPLKANPHMHLLEVSLAWHETADSDGTWGSLADTIAELALAKFIDPATGCLCEFFDGDWSRMADETGRIMEPGHHFEWGWLLIRWGRLRGREDAIKAARGLIEIAESRGVDPARDVAVNEMWNDFSPKEPGARLWPQTERLKAFLALAVLDPAVREDALQRAVAAARSLRGYLATPIAGMWRDKMRADGSFVEEEAPASTLYHIVCAIGEMHVATQALRP